MADTFDIFGKPVKKEVVYIGGGVVGIVVVVLIVRAHQASAAAAAAAATPADPGATSADGTSSNDLDPATGLLAGSPEDEAALAAQASGYYGVSSGGGVGGVTATGNPQGFTNNAQWAQAAEEYITGGTGGGGPTDAVGNALGKYITGQNATSDQVTIIEQAIAFENYPPVAGTDGYPPNIRTTTPPTTGGTGGTGGGSTAAVTVKVPPIVGLDAAQAGPIAGAAGLVITNLPAAVKGKVHIITSVKPAAGSTVAKGSKLTITYKTT